MKYLKIFLIMLAVCWIFNSCSQKEELIDAPEVIVAEISTDKGAVGDLVTIKGLNFSTIPTENIVQVNGIDARVLQASANQIIITVPPFATTGNLKVGRVGGRMSDAGIFTILPSERPTINEVMDVTGSPRRVFDPGEVMIIEGKGFNNQPNRNIVVFNNVLVPVSEIITATETRIELIVPGNAVSGPMIVNVTGSESLPVEITVNEIDPAIDGRLYWSETNVAPFGVLQRTVGASLFRGDDNVRTRPPGRIISSDTVPINVGSGRFFNWENYLAGDIDPAGDQYYTLSVTGGDSELNATGPFLRIVNLKTNKTTKVFNSALTRRNLDYIGTKIYCVNLLYQSRQATALIFTSKSNVSNIVELTRLVLNEQRNDIVEVRVILSIGQQGRFGDRLNDLLVGVSKTRIFLAQTIFEGGPFIATRVLKKRNLRVLDFNGNQIGFSDAFLYNEEGPGAATIRAIITSNKTDTIYFQETYRELGPRAGTGAIFNRGNYGIYYVDAVQSPSLSDKKLLYGPFDVRLQQEFNLDTGGEIDPATGRAPRDFSLEGNLMPKAVFGDTRIFFVNFIPNEGSVIFSIRRDGKSARPQRLYQGSLRPIQGIMLSSQR